MTIPTAANARAFAEAVAADLVTADPVTGVPTAKMAQIGMVFGDDRGARVGGCARSARRATP